MLWFICVQGVTGLHAYEAICAGAGAGQARCDRAAARTEAAASSVCWLCIAAGLLFRGSDRCWPVAKSRCQVHPQVVHPCFNLPLHSSAAQVTLPCKGLASESRTSSAPEQQVEACEVLQAVCLNQGNKARVLHLHQRSHLHPGSSSVLCCYGSIVSNGIVCSQALT